MLIMVLLTMVLLELDEVRTVALKIEPSGSVPEILVDSKENFYYRDFDENKVVKLDSTGKALLQFGRSGSGPGELQQPFGILLFNNEKNILITSLFGKYSIFDTHTGDFLSEFHINAGNQITHFTQKTFLSVGGPPDGHYFHTYTFSGDQIESWHKTPPYDPEKPYTRNYACVVDSEKTIYYAESTYPELLVVKEKSNGKIWKLKLPKHYIAPPERPLNKAIRFNRAKVREYYNSFTQINKLILLENHKLAIGWTIHQPNPGAVDIYDLTTRKLVRQQKESPGILVAGNKNRIYLLMEKEDDNLFEHSIFILEIP